MRTGKHANKGKPKMKFETGKTYHQQFENGDREYFLAVEQFKNGRWKGYRTTGNRKPVQTMGDPTVPYWLETPLNEIPKKLAQLA
jgi:hypothetical protein